MVNVTFTGSSESLHKLCWGWPPALKRVRKVCEECDVLLIADEVATGFGRTGTMWACEREGVVPDLMAIAKGITGGTLPLAATLATEEVYGAFLGDAASMRTFFHGHTYTGNPLGAAAAHATRAARAL